MGSFNFKNGNPNTDLLIHLDAGGTVDGIDILFDAFQDETEAANIAKFQDWYLRQLGIAPSAIGASYSLDTGTDTFKVQLRKELGLYNIEYMVNVARVLKYVKDQTLLDKVAASIFMADALAQYAGDRLDPLTPLADFITRTGGTTGDPILNFTPLLTDVVGTNASTALRELFEQYSRHVVGEVIPSAYFTYALTTGPDKFAVTIAVGQSNALNNLFLKLVASLHAAPLMSWYHACLGDTVTPLGLKAVVS